MTTNHIYLLIAFIEELKDLARVQQWINGARGVEPMNQAMQLTLDRKQAEVSARTAQIHDEMFEISRSN